jgi:putative aldouronate transport system permease protein
MKKEDRSFHIIGYIFLGLFTIVVIVPFLVLFSSSLTNENLLIRNGFPIIPTDIDLSAYEYIWGNIKSFLKAFSISILVTLVGTILNVTLTVFMAYPLSRRDLPFRNLFTFFVVFSILFNGGIVPTYLMYTSVFHIKNTLWGYIVPNLLLNGFSILITRSYFTNSIHSDLLDAAKIDGAGEWAVFWKIVLPISKPILATLALLAGMAYWNDWTNGIIYITKADMSGLQNFLYRIISNARFLNTTMSSNLSEARGMLPLQTLKMAVALLTTLPVIFAYIFLQKAFLRGITMGAVKE